MFMKKLFFCDSCSIRTDITVAFMLYPSPTCSNQSLCLTKWCRAQGTHCGHSVHRGGAALALQHPHRGGAAASVCVCLQFPRSDNRNSHSDLCIILPCFHPNSSEEQLFHRHLCACESAGGKVCSLQIKRGDKTMDQRVWLQTHMESYCILGSCFLTDLFTTLCG